MTLVELRSRMREALNQATVIVFLDEVMFTHKSIMSREYSNLHKKIKVEKDQPELKIN